MDNKFKIVTNNDGISIIINPDKKPVVEWRVYWSNNLWAPRVNIRQITFVPNIDWRYKSLSRLTQSEYIEDIVNNINIGTEDAAVLRLLLSQYVIAPYSIEVPSLGSDAEVTVFKSGEKDWRLLITQDETTQTVFLDCINHGTFTFYNNQQINTSAIAAFNELVFRGTLEYLCGLFECDDVEYDDPHLCLYYTKLVKQGFDVKMGTLNGVMAVRVRIANRVLCFGENMSSMYEENYNTGYTNFVPLPDSVLGALLVLAGEGEDDE